MIDRLQFISQESNGCTHVESIERACRAGVRWVQLRIKDAPQEVVAPQALEAKKVCDYYGAKLILNDYPALAKDVGAYGVHLGKEDMPVAEARQLVGDDLVIGATANTIEDIRDHCTNGADYIGLGPFRFTATKKKLSPLLGLEGYRNVLQQCQDEGLRVPLIAIGGIELTDIDEILQTEVHGIAVSSLISKAAKPEEVVEAILQKLHQKNTSHAYNS